jgi:methyl-accepting chemotaxis protein
MSEDVFRWMIAAGVALAAVAFAAQAVTSIAIYRVTRRMQNKVSHLADRSEPILDTTSKILEETRPRIQELSVEALEIARTAKVQVAQIAEIVKDTGELAKERISQIDHKVVETVDQMSEVGDVVKTVVTRPVREVNGILAGVRAAVTSFAHGGRRPSVDHATQDEEMFI